MKDTLKEISLLAIKLDSDKFSDEQKKAGWLGNNPSPIEEIELAEKKLGVELPNDYRQFLMLTDGFFTPCDSTEPTFEAVSKIDYLKNIDTYLLEIWNEGVLAEIGEELNKAIVVGGMNDEQYFFLIPPNYPVGKWQYWKFANWIPGEQRYENLESYFQSVLSFMKDEDSND